MRQTNPVYFLLNYSSKINFNIILPSRTMSSKCSPSLSSPHQNSVRLSLLPHTCHIHGPSHYYCSDEPNNIWWAVQTMKLLLKQCTPPSSSPSYSDPNTFLNTPHPIPCLSLHVTDQLLNPYERAWKIRAPYVSVSASSDSKQNTQSPGANDNRHSSNLTLSSFFHAYDFDLMGNFPNICTSTIPEEFISYLYVILFNF